MITFYTRSRSHYFGTIAKALEALSTDVTRDNLTSVTIHGTQCWSPTEGETDYDFRCRVSRGLKEELLKLKDAGVPVLVQERATYTRIYKLHILRAAIYALIAKEYGLPSNTSFTSFTTNPDGSCDVQYTITSETSSAPISM